MVESLVGEQGTHKGALVVADGAACERMVEDLRKHGAPASLAQLPFDVVGPERRDCVAAVLEWQPPLRPALELGVADGRQGHVDRRLEALGRPRRASLTVPYHAAAGRPG